MPGNHFEPRFDERTRLHIEPAGRMDICAGEAEERPTLLGA
jgi:hypothetical protein